MENNNNFNPQNEPNNVASHLPYEPKKRGMSTGGKVAVAICGGCGGLFFIAIILFFVLFSIGVNEAQKSLEGGDVETTSLFDSNGEVKDKGKVGNINDSVIVGNLKYTLLGYNVSDTIGSGFTQTTALEGATLVILDVVVENVGKEEEMLSESNLMLVDRDGVEFSSSFHWGSEMTLSMLNPKLSQTGQVVFEVPTATASEYLLLKIVDNSIWESELGYFSVDLDK